MLGLTNTSYLVKRLFVSLLFISLAFSTSQALQYRVFSNADFYQSSKPSKAGGFIGGTVDFFFTESFGRVDALTEIAVHPHGTKLAGVDIERIQVGYLFNDMLRVWTGRFHNLLGYWNLNYHHGLLLHTTIERPNFLNWEHDGGLIPTHMNGIWGEGRLKAGQLKLKYGVMVGNGPKIISLGPGKVGLQANNVGDDNKNKALSFNLTLAHRALPFTGLGFSGNIATIEENTQDTLRPDISTDQLIVGGHLFHNQEPVEFIGEYYLINDKDSSGATFSSQAFFVQIGIKIVGKFTPYFRFESVDVDEKSPYIVMLTRNKPALPLTGVNPSYQDYTKNIMGIRYDINVKSAIKLEFRLMNVPGELLPDDKDFWEAGIQWAFSL